MPPTIRKATPEDAALLLRVIDMASDGLVPAFWAEMAPEGTDGAAVGQALVTAEDGEFSYRYAFVAEREGVKLGGLIGYPLPTTPQPAKPETPEAFVPIEELVNLAPGYWYINFMAVDPKGRGQGLGAALLAQAEKQASGDDCPGLALIVVASNSAAMRVYRQAGYEERARRPFDLSAYGMEAAEAVLMVKDLV